MPSARKDIVSLEDTPFYHVISRCVRRAFLCGKDNYSGKNFDHRREWIIKRLDQISDCFCIRVCGYSLMSNHYHLVLQIDREHALNLSDREVVERWRLLFTLPGYLSDWYDGVPQDSVFKILAKQRIKVLRKRLYDIGWFMRCLNEPIARRANAEDKCKGRFWEGRYKS
ncbi:MAG: transposase, partial [Gammaproteobacteria bacterium]|nr:transposase [Gammaproteobacteria bacterium]